LANFDQTMPTQPIQPTEADKLLEDIHYVNQLTREEIKLYRKQLRRRVGAGTLSAPVAKSLVAELSTQLGQLSANVKITEKAIRSLQGSQKPAGQAKHAAAAKKADQKPGVVQFNASQLADNKNFLPVLVNENGESYTWSGANPDIELGFSLNRSSELEMQIRLFALIKPEYLKQLKVFVNGDQRKHWHYLDGSLFVVACLLPPASNSEQTRIKIVLPGTHCPADIGNSPDYRKLGIAISAIQFSSPESRLLRLLRRLRLMK